MSNTNDLLMSALTQQQGCTDDQIGEHVANFMGYHVEGEPVSVDIVAVSKYSDGTARMSHLNLQGNDMKMVQGSHYNGLVEDFAAPFYQTIQLINSPITESQATFFPAKVEA